eukprot:4471904-Lingulodinium_polyedra.AAC.1
MSSGRRTSSPGPSTKDLPGPTPGPCRKPGSSSSAAARPSPGWLGPGWRKGPGGQASPGSARPLSHTGA